MPAGPDETDDHKKGSITESVAKNPTSKTESTASSHHHHNDDNNKGEQVQFIHHEANPGPQISKEFTAQEEGTAEERRAKAAEMNQK